MEEFLSDTAISEDSGFLGTRNMSDSLLLENEVDPSNGPSLTIESSMIIHNYPQALKQVMRIFIPLTIDNMIFYSAGFIDGIIIGRLSTEVLASSSLISNIKQFALLPLSASFYALQPLISVAGESEDARQTIGQFIRASLILSISYSVLIIPLLLTSHYAVQGIEPLHSKNTNDYFKFFSISVPAQFLIAVINNLLLSTKKSSVMVPFSLIRTTTEIGLSALMVYGLNLGISGWGIATGIQPWVALIMMGGPTLCFKSAREYLKKCGVFDSILFDAELKTKIKEVFIVGFPITLQLAVTLANGLLGSFAAGYLGTNQLASYQIASSVALWSIMFLDSTTPTLSVTLPLLRTDLNARKLLINTIIMLSAISSFIFLCVPPFIPRQLVSIFNSSSDPAHEEIVSMCATLIPIMSVTAPLYASKAVITGILRSDKKTMAPLIAEIIGLLCNAGLLGITTFIFEDINLISGSQMIGLFISMLALIPFLFNAFSNSHCTHRLHSFRFWEDNDRLENILLMPPNVQETPMDITTAIPETHGVNFNLS